MAERVTRDKLFFAFKPELTPALHAAQGESILLETHDCFEGQIQRTQDLVDKLDWNHVNPATGPVYIEGAKPGDILRVDLLEIKVGKQASMVTIPGEGALGDVITQMETAILKLEGNEIVFKDKIRIPKKPMIGVIGVAPASGRSALRRPAHRSRRLPGHPQLLALVRPRRTTRDHRAGGARRRGLHLPARRAHQG